MPRAQCNGFGFDMPRGWSDASIYMFVAPPDEGPALPTLGQVRDPMISNVVIRREMNVTGEVLAQMVEHNAQEMAARPHTKLTREFALELNVGRETVNATGREFETVTDEGLPAGQLHLYFVAGGSAYLFIGTAPSLETRRDTFLAMARSLRLEP